MTDAAVQGGLRQPEDLARGDESALSRLPGVWSTALGVRVRYAACRAPDPGTRSRTSHLS